MQVQLFVETILLETHMEHEIFLSGGGSRLDVVPSVAYRCCGLEGPLQDLGRECDDYRIEGIRLLPDHLS